jgi:phosphoglycerate dehydrogenase-like enzyme
MKKINVLFYARKQEPPQWRNAIVEAFGDKHNLKLYDLNGSVEQFKDADVVVDCGGWGTREMIDAAKKCKLWQILGTGLDHTDVAYIKSKGMKAANCPGQFSSVGLAECAMMFILMLTRHWHNTQKKLADGIMYNPFGRTLDGLTLGVIGFGASSQDLAVRAKSFGMKIEAIDIVKPSEDVMNLIKPAYFGGPDKMDDVIKRCDFLSLHLHLTDKTRHIIDARRIGLMKPTACIINVARGGLVDETAMMKAVKEGKIAGAGLDVYGKEPPELNDEFYRLENVILTNHIAGVTNDTGRKRAKAALENANLIAQGLEPLYQV